MAGEETPRGEGRCYALTMTRVYEGRGRRGDGLERCYNAATVTLGDQRYCGGHAERLLDSLKAQLAGLVYFAQREEYGLIKIGYSQDPERRCADLKARLLATEPGGRRRETALHRHFAHLRREFEWFEPEDELVRYIRRLRIQDVAA